MIAGFLLALREGMEVALIVSISIGALKRMNQNALRRSVWAGVFVATLLSLTLGFAIQLAGAELEGLAEALFEGVTTLLAAGILSWMIFWMYGHGMQIQDKVRTSVHQAAGDSRQWGLFTLAFFAVLREGVETALFLTAAGMTTAGASALLGGVLGLIVAGLLGWGLFAATVRLNIRRFFLITGGLLLLFAAGLVAHGVHEFNELGWIPRIVEHVWDTSGFVNQGSPLGQLLKTLFGYNASPSLSEVLAYAGYLSLVLLTLLRMRRPTSLTQQA